jgi:hypothetical protein
MLRIIDHKRIDLTESEYKLYQEICRAYDTPKFKGEDLFKDLFETNEHGIIIFLRPPSKTYTSMEVYMFLVNIMVHQHLGQACDHSSQISKKCLEATKEAKIATSEAKELINELKKSRDR